MRFSVSPIEYRAMFRAIAVAVSMRPVFNVFPSSVTVSKDAASQHPTAEWRSSVIRPPTLSEEASRLASAEATCEALGPRRGHYLTTRPRDQLVTQSSNHQRPFSAQDR